MFSLKSFTRPFLQDDQLDVLAADVDDHVRVVVELHGRFGVRDGFDERRVGLQHVPQTSFA